MSRSLLIAFLAAAFLVAPAVLLSAFAPAVAPGFSWSAQAATNLNSSRSNVSRMGGGGGSGPRSGAKTTTVKSSKSNSSDRMGGGGGKGSAGKQPISDQAAGGILTKKKN